MKHLNFEPYIYEEGKRRKPKDDEAWDMTQKGLAAQQNVYVWDEPLSWFLLDHVPFRTVIGWYTWEWRFKWWLRWQLFMSRHGLVKTYTMEEVETRAKKRPHGR